MMNNFFGSSFFSSTHNPTSPFLVVSENTDYSNTKNIKISDIKNLLETNGPLKTAIPLKVNKHAILIIGATEEYFICGFFQ